MEKKWESFSFNVPFTSVSESVASQDDMYIQGIAINETVTRNGIKYEAQELENSAHTLKNKPLLKDHVNSVDNIVGRVKEARYDNLKKAIVFKAVVNEKSIKEKIADGRLTNVSIGASVKDLVKTKKDGEDYLIARGLEFLELSFTPVPGDPNASFTTALAEAFNTKEKILTTLKEEEETSEEEEEMEEKQEENVELQKLKEELAKKNEILEQIKKEKFDKEYAEYRALCEKKGIKARDNLNESELKLLKEVAEELDDEEEEEVEEKVTKSKVKVAETKNEWEGFVLEKHGNTGALWKMPNQDGGLK